MTRLAVPRLLRLAVVLAIGAGTSCGLAEEAAPRSPVAPRDSLQFLRLDDGLRIELAACEPQIVDPVTVRFDERGRMWVVEYRDYPNGPPSGGKPLSRIKLLEDLDGDGFYETAHTFADELSFCNGLQPWRGGVIATMAGRVAFLKDTDDDRRADVVETWFTGFAEENPQLRVNHPRFGLDNHVYLANGLRGGTAANPRNPKAPPVSLRGHDLKFDPRTGAFEAIAGNGQFGLTFDDWGNRFLCSNRNPCYHVVFEDRYLARNPNYAVPAVVHDVAAAGEASRVFPTVKAWTTSILHAGQFTAACGLDVYRGDALPAEYYGNVFTCEPTGSLVHREVIAPAGATFTGRSPYEGREFLTSTDPWFRPVFCEGGPDGALYVCDMYRAVIEHPQFMPDELKNRPDLRAGDDRGRIYRIVGNDFRRPTERPNLYEATTQQLVQSLDHANAWRRETAQRLLIERGDGGAAEALAAKVRNGRTPQGKVQALWSLAGLNALTNDLLAAALQDADPRVREQAVRLAELRLDDGNLLRQTLALLDDPDLKLSFQAALTVGARKTPDKATPARLAALLLRSKGDPWIQTAVAVSASENAASILVDLISRPRKSSEFESERRVIRSLASWVTSKEPAESRQQLGNYLRKQKLEPTADAGKLMIAIVAGLSKSSPEGFLVKLGFELPENPQDRIRVLNAQNTLLITIALGAVERDLDLDTRLDCLDVGAGFLAHADRSGTSEPIRESDSFWRPFIELIRNDPDSQIRSKALALLTPRRGPEVGEVLLSLLPKQSPAVRGQILDALLARPERVRVLLDALESGKLKPRELDQARATRLLKTTDPAVKARAEKLLASAMPADRTKALEDYRRVLSLTADPRRGLEVFRKNCASCHKVGDVGIEVGPSIADLRTKTPEQVLVDVIQPNKAIDNNFVSYTLVTNDGLQYVGILGAETPGSVTLKLPDGKTVAVLKKDIDELTSNGVSLMPEGVERQIPHQDMADVISFVKNWRYLEGAVPGAPGAPPSAK